MANIKFTNLYNASTTFKDIDKLTLPTDVDGVNAVFNHIEDVDKFNWEVGPQPTSVVYTTPFTQLVYTEGDKLDTTGMVVTATYADSSTENVASRCLLIPSKRTALIPTNESVTIKYNGLVFTQDITVHPDYLCFTAVTAGSTIKLTLVGTPPTTKSFAYSTDRVTWTSFSFAASGDSSTTITLANVGDKVYFRGTNNTLGESASIYNKFIMTGSISADGDLNRLLSYSENITDLTNKNYCFINLFNGCTSLVSMPKLPATVLSVGCYQSLFNGCTNLVNVYKLPAITLLENCYTSMFEGCEALIESPDLMATTLVKDCCTTMFKGCINLSSIRVVFTQWYDAGEDRGTRNWVEGVPPQGVFNCPSALAKLSDANHIPLGWSSNIE